MLINELCLPLAMADVIMHLYDITGCDHKCDFYGLEKKQKKQQNKTKTNKQTKDKSKNSHKKVMKSSEARVL